ncbi:F-box/LRR-repeat protein At4g14096-like isoform X2 [Rhododendron vialii]|uniref:F-box/LRR-repeat protein At4g14096-like isoform X2 n=1 Tax=Rhododendron vialii TaxID=182163 RepID=UPI00265DF99B|nr:F-box/LRR-repeat protein At4g14096-like isoform X2 [Rhododendron vialii]
MGELPWSLFTCKTLVILKIHGKFIFYVPQYVCLPDLKTLCLNSLIYLDDGLISKFLSGCPALEDLVIRRPGWDNMWTLDVSVPSLKRLTLDISIHEEELYHEPVFKYKVMVNAPNLEYLDFFDTVSAYISVGGLPSVVEAHVNVHKSFRGDWIWRRRAKYGNRTSELLRSISNVWRLSLTGYTLRCLSYGGPNLATYRNLVYLELGFDPSNGPLLLLNLLQSSPKLEVLVFPEGLTVIREQECDVNRDIFFDYRWNPPERVPECLLLSLEKIEIHKFCGDEEEELNLVKYLLKNGMVLEKVTIWCHYLFGGDNSFSFKDELENYPRGSTNCNFRLYIPYLVPISSSS